MMRKVADDARSCGGGLVLDAVAKRLPGDLRHERDDRVLVVGNRACKRVKVSGKSTSVTCREEHPPLITSLWAVWRSAEPREPAFDDVEREEILRASPFRPLP